MVTPFGKVLRIIRINTGDSLRDMAEKLGVSASYLSAIENGKRAVPTSLEAVICEKYTLSNNDREKLKNSVIESSEVVKIDLTELAEKRKKVIFKLASDDIDDDTLDKLCEIIKKGENK